MSMQLFLKDAQFDNFDLNILENNGGSPSSSNRSDIYLRNHINNQFEEQQTPVSSSVWPTWKTSEAPNPLVVMHQEMESVIAQMLSYKGLCWYCALSCADLSTHAWPLVVPKDTAYRIKAITCSFPCLTSYIYNQYRYNKQKRERLLSYAKQIFIMYQSKQPKILEAGLDRRLLTTFGGRLSSQEFKDQLESIFIKLIRQ